VIVIQGDQGSYIERLRQARAALARPEPHLLPSSLQVPPDETMLRQAELWE